MGYLHKYSCKHFCGPRQTRVRLNIPKLEVLKGFDEDLNDIGAGYILGGLRLNHKNSKLS